MMTPTQRKAMEQALEALNGYRRVVTKHAGLTYAMGDEAITALRAALEEQPAEQVTNIGCLGMPVNTPVTAPQSAKQPLTDEEIRRMWEPHYSDPWADYKDFARAIEAAHGITGEAK